MKQLFLLLLVQLFLTACVGWPSPQSNATGLGDLTLGLWASHQSLNVNQPITIRFTVKNDGKQTIVYDRKDKPVVDILVGHRDNPAMRWSSEKPLTSELTRLELKPGESRILEMIWAPSEEYKFQVISISGRV